MIEQFFQTGGYLIEKQENLYLLGDAILFLCFLIFVLYIFTFAVNSKRKPLYTYPIAKKKYRFAVLFPAYKEDIVILDSVNSFLRQEYPQELYDVIVISNQMTPQTVEDLKELPIQVVEMDSLKCTKIEALQKAIEYIEKENLKYDNIVVLDADNVVDPSYLSKINDALYAGCSVLQTHRVAKNRDSNVAVLDSISEEINNSIFRKGHTRLGFSSALSGSGMAFEYDLFKETIEKCSGIGEDKYMERILLFQNIYIEYLEDVYTYDEKVRGKKDFYNQRQRWLTTQFSNLFSGILKMPVAMLKGKWDYCDKLFQWMMPPRVLLLGFIILIAIILTILDFVASIKWWCLLILLGITFSIAVPDYLVDKKFKKAIISVPILFILMFLNVFRIGGKHFSHTQHSNKKS
ncbi:glycosyltransferase family 2 protein [Parabacteroides sp. ZJ-118]|uniref:glycosyltransferase n=1 Tax=Parabacteroides sp. ZJ-118 TaxID=2709398 RepID=UPI0013E9A8F7|nr:glycosyltransferase family 2 protein [Parabacteroides sp. ZJ-118]